MNLNNLWKRITRNTYLSDFFLILFFPFVTSWHYFKGRAIKLILISVLAAFCFDIIFNGLLSKNILKTKPTNDIALSVYMGACTAMMLPQNAPFWFPILGLLLAYAFSFLFFPLLSKLLKLSYKVKLMQASLAITFLSFFKKYMFSYTSLIINDGDAIFEQVASLPSLSYILKTGIFPAVGMYSKADILTGAVAGPIGTSCILVILAGLIFLVLRKPRFALAPMGFLGLASLFSLLFPRHNLGPLASLGYELSAGMMFFALVFLLPLPQYLPKKDAYKVVYGALAGLLTMLFRRFGPWEEAVCLALLIMNFTNIIFDTYLNDFDKLLNNFIGKIFKPVKKNS